MKLIIDIPEEKLNIIKNKMYCGIYDPDLYQAMANGIQLNKSAMMWDIYKEGVNMAGEYQGCWVRFKDIEKIIDKYIPEKGENGKTEIL